MEMQESEITGPALNAVQGNMEISPKGGEISIDTEVDSTSFYDISLASTSSFNYPPPTIMPPIYNASQPPPPPPIGQPQLPSSQLKQKPHPCRDHSRGNCTRPNCKFSHEIDITAIKEINFCHDFQNKICTRPKCKYVHATAVQQAEYYRTKTLPNDVLQTFYNNNNCQLVNKDLQSGEPIKELQFELSQLASDNTPLPPSIDFNCFTKPPPSISKNYQTHPFQVSTNLTLPLPSTKNINVSSSVQMSPECHVQNTINQLPPETNMETYAAYQHFNINDSEIPRKKIKYSCCTAQEALIKQYEETHRAFLSEIMTLLKEIDIEEQKSDRLMAEIVANQKYNQTGDQSIMLYLLMRKFMCESQNNKSNNADNHVIDIPQQPMIKPNTNQQLSSVPSLSYMLGNSGQQILLPTGNTPQMPCQLNPMPQQLLRIAPQAIGSDMQHLISSERQTFNPERQTFNPERQTFNPERQTFNPELQTFNPERQTFNPERQTFNPERQTFNPEQQTFNPEQLVSQSSERQNFYIDNQSHGNLNDFQMFKNLNRNMSSGNNDKYVVNIPMQSQVCQQPTSTNQHLNSNQYTLSNNHNQQLIGVTNSETQPYVGMNTQLLNIGQYPNQPFKQQYQQQFTNTNQYVNQPVPIVLASVNTQNTKSPGTFNFQGILQ